MTYLLYGIVKDPASSPILDSRLRGNDDFDIYCPRNLTGVKGKPVIFVKGHGLCAAVSDLDVEEGAPPVAELLNYSQVVEALYRRQAVIPMRYGCFLNGIQAIRDVLKARQRQYETMLAELAGHVEMGIRILLPEKERNLRQGETMNGQGALSTTVITAQPKEEPAINGRAYLVLRKVHYQMQEETSHGRQVLIDRYIQAFSGLYARHRIETDMKNGDVILSLYFLTPKSDVNRFRETFGNMMEKGNDEAILSGPWPPYNFVTTELVAAK
ncbi:MAG: GvpL/GvpF family gas vesicle protein [Deltaproteobacteria bacterium]|nr:GvpL/GvpF family gas vesicle protein [Deltaproteobacteria bacterium]